VWRKSSVKMTSQRSPTAMPSFYLVCAPSSDRSTHPRRQEHQEAGGKWLRAERCCMVPGGSRPILRGSTEFHGSP
jgi:hypothetical protein